MRLLAVLLVLALTTEATNGVRFANNTPVVLIHGLMASAEAMSHMQQWIEADFAGRHTLNVHIGNGKDDSLLMDINKQVELVAAQVAADPLLANGFDLIGHSQGGLLARAYIERFNKPPVRRFVSLAGPQQGVFGVPDFNALCPDDECPWLAEMFSLLLNDFSWVSKEVQKLLSFAAYWHDPFEEQLFAENSIFLGDINNAGKTKNATYRANMISLEKMLLVMAENDTIVVPKQSPWFDFYDFRNGGSDSRILKWNETPGYLGDWIGLQTLQKANKVERVSFPCAHADLPLLVCKPYYDKHIKPFLT